MMIKSRPPCVECRRRTLARRSKTLNAGAHASVTFESKNLRASAFIYKIISSAPDTTWCEALSSRGQNLKITRSSGKWARPLGNPYFKTQIASKWRILDKGSDDFWHRFHMRPPQVLTPITYGGHRSRFCQILENVEEIDFLNARFMKSIGVKDQPWFKITRRIATALCFCQRIISRKESSG